MRLSMIAKMSWMWFAFWIVTSLIAILADGHHVYHPSSLEKYWSTMGCCDTDFNGGIGIMLIPYVVISIFASANLGTPEQRQ